MHTSAVEKAYLDRVIWVVSYPGDVCHSETEMLVSPRDIHQDNCIEIYRNFL